MSDKMEMFELHLSWLFKNIKAVLRVGGNAVRVETKRMLLGIIPIGTRNETVQVRNITSVVINTKIRIGSLILAVFFAYVGLRIIVEGEGFGPALIALVFAILFALSVPNTVLTISKNDGAKIFVDILPYEKDQAEVVKTSIEDEIYNG